jgi:hypothetical protein
MGLLDTHSKSARHGDSTPQLSCELCRERKVKCDKRTPCSNCAKSGLQCVPIHRKRLPRGRHAQSRSSEDNIEKRLRKLENMLENLNGSSPEPVRTPKSTVDVLAPGGLD